MDPHPFDETANLGLTISIKRLRGTPGVDGILITVHPRSLFHFATTPWLPAVSRQARLLLQFAIRPLSRPPVPSGEGEAPITASLLIGRGNSWTP